MDLTRWLVGRVHGVPREAACACVVHVVCLHRVHAPCVHGQRPREPTIEQLAERWRRVSAFSRVRAAEHGHAPHAEVEPFHLDAICACAGGQLAWPAADRSGPLWRTVLQRWSSEGGVASRDAVADECDAPRPRSWKRAVRYRCGTRKHASENHHLASSQGGVTSV